MKFCLLKNYKLSSEENLLSGEKVKSPVPKTREKSLKNSALSVFSNHSNLAVGIPIKTRNYETEGTEIFSKKSVTVA